jgi:hypothetical protein
MAIIAIADRRQIATSFDEGGIESQRSGRLDRRNRRAPHDCKGSRRATKQHDGNDAGDNSGRSGHAVPCAPFAFIAVGLYFNTVHPPSFTRDSINCR